MERQWQQERKDRKRVRRRIEPTQKTAESTWPNVHPVTDQTRNWAWFGHVDHVIARASFELVFDGCGRKVVAPSARPFTICPSRPCAQGKSTVGFKAPRAASRFGRDTVVVMAGPCRSRASHQVVSKTAPAAWARSGARVLRCGAYKPRFHRLYRFRGWASMD